MEPYSIENYKRPSIAVDAVVFGIKTINTDKSRSNQKKLQILLVKRKEEPFAGQFALPGGFLRENETLETAIGRELKEETGLENIDLIPLQTYSDPNRDPRGWILSCAYIALCPTVTPVTDTDSDAEFAEWLDFSEDMPLAFDHTKIIRDGFRKLKDEVMNHDILFRLVPAKFTLTELQNCYQAITGHITSAPAFRKRMANKIIETNEFETKQSHRPARIFIKKGNAQNGC